MTTQAPVPTPPSSYGPSPFPSPKVLVSPTSPGDCSHPLQTLSSLVQALTEPPPLNLLPLDSDCKYLHTQPTPAPVLQPPRTDSRRRRQNRHREIHRRRGRGRARSRQIDGKKKKKKMEPLRFLKKRGQLQRWTHRPRQARRGEVGNGVACHVQAGGHDERPPPRRPQCSTAPLP